MSKRYLGIVCLLYSGLITYTIVFDKLKNFLAPTMQLYIKLAVLPMFVFGLVILFNKKNTYKFRLSDLILLLPIIIFILTQDGRLTSTLVKNKSNIIRVGDRKKVSVKDKKKEEEKEELKSEEVVEKNEEKYDFSKPDFEIVDANYDALSSYLTYEVKAKKFIGKTIKFRGFAVTKAQFLPKGYLAVGKYSISCCVADAGFTGFIIKADDRKLKNDSWYEIEGVLEEKENEAFMYVRIINLKEIKAKSEEQYIYPCYSYGDGSCSEVTKYDIEY